MYPTKFEDLEIGDIIEDHGLEYRIERHIIWHDKTVSVTAHRADGIWGYVYLTEPGDTTLDVLRRAADEREAAEEYRQRIGGYEESKELNRYEEERGL